MICFRRVETDKTKGLARNPNRVPVDYLNLARTDWGSIRNRRDKEKNAETTDHRLFVPATKNCAEFGALILATTGILQAPPPDLGRVMHLRGARARR